MGMCCSTPVDIEKRIGYKVIKGHTGKINSVAISSDNTFIISGSNDKTIRIWDVVSGECIKILEGHNSRISSVALSKNNNDQFIVSGSWDKTVRLWDRVTGESIKTFCGHSFFVSCVDISPNSKYIVSSGSEDKTARIWDVETGECCKVLGVGREVISVCFSNDNQFVLSGDDAYFRLWDVETGHCTREIRGGTRAKVALSSNCKYIVTAKGRIVSLVDVEKFETIKEFEGHTTSVESLFLSANDQWIVSGAGHADDFVRLWNVETGKHTRLKSGGASGQDIDSVVFSADNRYIVSGAGGWGMCLWNVESITCKNVDTRTENPLQ